MIRFFTYVTVALTVLSFSYFLSKPGSTCVEYFHAYGCQACINLKPKLEYINFFSTTLFNRHDIWLNSSDSDLHTKFVQNSGTSLPSAIPLAFVDDVALLSDAIFGFGMWDAVVRGRNKPCPDQYSLVNDFSFPKHGFICKVVAVIVSALSASFSPSLFGHFLTVGNNAASRQASVTMACTKFVIGLSLALVFFSTSFSIILSNFGILIYVLLTASFLLIILGFWHLIYAHFPAKLPRPHCPNNLSLLLVHKINPINSFRFGFASFFLEFSTLIPVLLITVSMAGYSFGFFRFFLSLFLITCVSLAFVLFAFWCYLMDWFMLPYNLMTKRLTFILTVQGILFLFSGVLWWWK
ncbi:hypothetical protein RCL1_000648 [Eukaryota sp. TZLM3-RCL]